MQSVQSEFWRKHYGGRDHLKDTDIHGVIILERIFKKWGKVLTGLIWQRRVTSVFCVLGYETSSSVQCMEFLD